MRTGSKKLILASIVLKSVLGGITDMSAIAIAVSASVKITPPWTKEESAREKDHMPGKKE